MSIRVLFADDQLPSPIDSENEQTRREIRRELADRPGIKDIDAAFDEDFAWFQALLDYLERTKHLHVVRARSFIDAKQKLERLDDFDVAVIDLSWWGDASLPPGRQHRHNRGLDLIEQIARGRRSGGAFIPTIALSQNFKDDFELMATVLEMDALPIPKSYDARGLCHRALFAAIQHLSRLRPTTGRVKLFISHAHRDVDIAERIVTALELAMNVPDGAIRCTSVPGYKLDLGAMAPDVLRQELASAEGVVAILTPYSLASQWVLFELGATWLQTKQAIPLLGGGLRDEDIPGPLRGAAGGQLKEASALAQFLDQVMKKLGWPPKNMLAAYDKLSQLATYVAGKSFFEDDLEQEAKARFGAKRARIGATQGKIVDYITHNLGNRAYVPQEELYARFRDVQTHLYYRLEQLRYLGFLTRRQIGSKGDYPDYGWTLSAKYEAELKEGAF
jgi:hypothetical protein